MVHVPNIFIKVLLPRVFLVDFFIRQNIRSEDANIFLPNEFRPNRHNRIQSILKNYIRLSAIFSNTICSRISVKANQNLDVATTIKDLLKCSKLTLQFS